MSNKSSRRSNRQATEIKPKILLKSENQNATTTTPSQSGYIASQEFLNRSVAAPTPTKPSQGNAVTIASHPETAPAAKDMKCSVEIFLTNGTVNSELTQFRDNTFFRVIAVLGRGPQKANILNCLLDQNPENVFQGSGKGTQMFITKDRQIILNITNTTKTGREGDAETITMYLSLLKICHTVIFVEPEMEARSCIRLLRCAELMDFGYDKLGLNMEYLPNILFIAHQWQKTTLNLFNDLFKGSRLQDNVHIIDKCVSDSVLHQTLTKLAYRIPRVPMTLTTPSTFTESHWYQIVQALWKLHKTNYFLLKYVR